jgi:type IV pilus biogenesis protein PilP
MRIANNLPRAQRKPRTWFLSPSLVLCAALGFLPAIAPIHAQAANAMSPMNAVAAPVIAPPPASVPSLPPVAAIDPTLPDPSKPVGADMNKSTASMEDKITENAKTLVKRLDKSADAMTLEDLNEARQTVTRIEAMIDIEKHLSELDKIRKERNGEGSGSSLASAIPASALAPAPHMFTQPFPPMGMSSSDEQPVFRKPAPSTANIEISRISGSEGRYSAMLKLSNGDLKTVRSGDQVAPDVTVQAIASSSVVLDENGKTRTLHIKNVDVIYSALR